MTQKIEFVLLAVIASSLLFVFGCSNEQSSSAADAVKPVAKSSDTNPILTSRQPVLPPEEGLNSADFQQTPQLPTRSELRVLTEETKATEANAQQVIERFDSNLSDPAQRKIAQDEFKQMLPGYKEKMLQIGKSQLSNQP